MFHSPREWKRQASFGGESNGGIREGLEENRPDEAKEGVRKVAAAIDALAAQIEQAAALLKKTLP